MESGLTVMRVSIPYFRRPTIGDRVEAVFAWTGRRANATCLRWQGDAYSGESGFLNTALIPSAGDDERLQGGNMLTRWTHTLEEDNDVALQLYYDRADRLNDIGFLDQEFNTYDLDFRHHFPLNASHNFIWGLGFRSVSDKITPLAVPSTTVISFDPAERTLRHLQHVRAG